VSSLMSFVGRNVASECRPQSLEVWRGTWSAAVCGEELLTALRLTPPSPLAARALSAHAERTRFSFRVPLITRIHSLPLL
jgi:hypothetical protein